MPTSHEVVQSLSDLLLTAFPVGKTRAGGLAQQTLDQSGGVGLQARHQAAQFEGLQALMAGLHFIVRAAEGSGSGEQQVHGHAQGVHVGSHRQTRAGDLLGRHGHRRADDLLVCGLLEGGFFGDRLGVIGIDQTFAQGMAEVDDTDVDHLALAGHAVDIDDDSLRAEVAMDHRGFFPGMAEPLGNLQGDLQHLDLVHAPALGHQGGERRTCHVFGREVGSVADEAVTGMHRDVGMVEPRQEGDGAGEAGDLVFIRRAQDVDAHQALDDRFARLPHRTKGISSKLTVQRVVIDAHADASHVRSM